MPASVRRFVVFVLLVAAAAGCAKRGVQSQPGATVPAPTGTEREAPRPTPAGERNTEDEPVALEFEPAFFAYDSDHLDERARTALDLAARALRDRPGLALRIEGHCDERGTVEYNQALGERRAQAARDYLVASGIPPTRVDLISYGKERPFADGHDEQAWALNRRAHLIGR